MGIEKNKAMEALDRKKQSVKERLLNKYARAEDKGQSRGVLLLSQLDSATVLQYITVGLVNGVALGFTRSKDNGAVGIRWYYNREFDTVWFSGKNECRGAFETIRGLIEIAGGNYENLGDPVRDVNLEPYDGND